MKFLSLLLILIPSIAISQWDTTHIIENGVSCFIAKNVTNKGTLTFKKAQGKITLSLDNVINQKKSHKIRYIFTFYAGKTDAISTAMSHGDSIILERDFIKKSYIHYFKSCEKLTIVVDDKERYYFNMSNTFYHLKNQIQ
jgi:uncharacterized protein YneR